MHVTSYSYSPWYKVSLSSPGFGPASPDWTIIFKPRSLQSVIKRAPQGPVLSFCTETAISFWHSPHPYNVPPGSAGPGLLLALIPSCPSTIATLVFLQHIAHDSLNISSAQIFLSRIALLPRLSTLLLSFSNLQLQPPPVWTSG